MVLDLDAIVSALLDTFDEMFLHLFDDSSSTCVDMIYLDSAKAFDKVDHGFLMHKLKSIGVSGNLGMWIGNFLRDRTECVRIKGSTSNPASVTSSVPQGTVLDPVLFPDINV